MSETSGYRYAIIGSGRQATATAYDLARYSDAAEIIMADIDGAVASATAQRINKLIGRDVAVPRQLDVRDYDAVVALLQDIDLVVCGTPFVYIMPVTRAAIEAKASLVDFGGHTGTVFRQLELDERAQEAGICIVPDCGMGPGMNNTLGAYVVEAMDEPREVYLWDGGLMQNPVPPWNYQLTFHINGLTNEYYGESAFLRDGKITMVTAFTEHEEIDFPPLGKLEAFVTTGGTSTAPYTFEGVLQTYQNKTCRWLGHYAQFKAFQQLGLFSEEPVMVKGQKVTPREVYHALLEPKLTPPDGIILKDVCMMRCKGVGIKDGKEAVLTVDMIDYYDEETGFTAMERMTGWHAAIMAEFIMRGKVRKGATRMEQAVVASEFVAAARDRGFKIEERWEFAG